MSKLDLENEAKELENYKIKLQLENSELAERLEFAQSLQVLFWDIQKKNK